METKLIAMTLGVALVLATATVYTQSVFAVGSTSSGGGGSGTGGSGGDNGGTSGTGENGGGGGSSNNGDPIITIFHL